MNKEQVVFEKLTLGGFKKWSSTALKIFIKSNMIMTNNSGKIRIS